jgi:hypothetical protein
MTISLEAPLPTPSSGTSKRGGIQQRRQSLGHFVLSTGSLSGRALSTLLPMGFTRHACLQAPGALLPHHFTLAVNGGLFLWHFPSGHPARPLAGIAALWSPDFPLHD